MLAPRTLFTLTHFDCSQFDVACSCHYVTVSLLAMAVRTDGDKDVSTPHCTKAAQWRDNVHSVPWAVTAFVANRSCSPLTAHRSPLTARGSPLTAHRSRLTTHLSTLTSHRSPLNAHRSPLTAHLSPLTAHLSPLTVHRSPFVTFPGSSHHKPHHSVSPVGLLDIKGSLYSRLTDRPHTHLDGDSKA
jgi:hypothetical protein